MSLVQVQTSTTSMVLEDRHVFEEKWITKINI
jgi:hypothetical protein